MNTHRKFNECKRTGTAQHYVSCLWLCRAPMCEHIQQYADVQFCKISIRADIRKMRENERKRENEKEAKKDGRPI